MALAAEMPMPPLTVEWLTTRTFDFRAEPKGQTISDRLVFHPNGFIVGYNHPNEAYWDLDGNDVLIIDLQGMTTCRLSFIANSGGTPCLAGNFISPWDNYATTATRHILTPNSSDLHTHIQSFDLFDTLVARRCFGPLEIFRRVEEKSGVANFAARRHLVEMSMFGRRNYGLDDIYDLLIQEKTLTNSQAKMVKLMELDEEWDNLFPMRQVTAFVNPDDIIISDMYLPQSFVERIVREKCGLNNKVYLSNYGKHHRIIWPSIKQEYKLRVHYGDNQNADIKGAAEFGIPATYVSLSKWDRTEEILHEASLGPYAHALRETRLQTFHRNAQVRNALQAQISINIPLMLLGTFWLRHQAEMFGATRIMAAARDCNLLIHLLSSTHFARHGLPPADYVRMSRTLCYSDTPEFEAYFRSKLGERTLLVDFVGTGRSMKTFVERTGLQDKIMPCLLVGDDVAPEARVLQTMIHRDYYKCRMYLEALNASLDGSAVLARVNNHLVSVEQQPNEFSDFMKVIITEMRANFFRFLPSLDRFAPPKAPVPLDKLLTAAEAIADLFPAHMLKMHYLGEEQRRNMRRGVAAQAAAE
ncbi:hypothetical protein PDO_1700 [Rhizobium sp. PDO1-076]|uniref:hypothetical protein n=3 Tax=Rhizobium TaxID=379 RepID=UPI00024E23CA|nr:hypothetical protein [Rhizobium sp. PDO1-076]EHS51931.1 hypothetical protein PDO_1700 [Rhizobium sp. PDO1-076]